VGRQAPIWCLGLALALLVGSGAPAAAREPRGAPVPDFLLLDQKGRAHALSRLDGKAVVVFVTGNGCPLARQSVPALQELRKAYFERGVTFWMLDANLQDDRASIAKEADALDVDRIPILHDETEVVARALGVTHTGEAVAIALPERRIFYRGPVDDRLAIGGQRALAQHLYLRDAIEERLAGHAIVTPVVPASGCAVGLEPARPVSYMADVAPVLARRCGGCHAPGGAKPALGDYARARAAAAGLRRVLLERSMPPAAPDPDVGAPLADGLVLPADEARTLARWLDAGMPRGAEPAPAPAPPRPAPVAPAPAPEVRAVSAEAVTIPAEEGEAGRAFGILRLPRPTFIHDFRPRMDRRGSWFKVDALYPDGHSETLFSLPALAGPWRQTYALAQPKRVPAGTLLHATGAFDNSRRNPANPAPERRLTCVGPACDELFVGLVGVSEDVAGATKGKAP
jgi:peroxiredoxin